MEEEEGSCHYGATVNFSNGLTGSNTQRLPQWSVMFESRKTVTSSGTEGAAESEGSPVCCGIRVRSKKTECTGAAKLQVYMRWRKSESHGKLRIHIFVFNNHELLNNVYMTLLVRSDSFLGNTWTLAFCLYHYLWLCTAAFYESRCTFCSCCWPKLAACLAGNRPEEEKCATSISYSSIFATFLLIRAHSFFPQTSDSESAWTIPAACNWSRTACALLRRLLRSVQLKQGTPTVRRKKKKKRQLN